MIIFLLIGHKIFNVFKINYEFLIFSLQFQSHFMRITIKYFKIDILKLLISEW